MRSAWVCPNLHLGVRAAWTAVMSVVRVVTVFSGVVAVLVTDTDTAVDVVTASVAADVEAAAVVVVVVVVVSSS